MPIFKRRTSSFNQPIARRRSLMSKSMLQDESYKFQFINWNLTSNSPCCSINLDKSQGFEFNNDRNRLISADHQMGGAIDVIDIHITEDEEDYLFNFDIYGDLNCNSRNSGKLMGTSDGILEDDPMDGGYSENVDIFKRGFKMA